MWSVVRALSLALVLVASSGCATVRVDPISAGGAQGQQEAALWMRAHEYDSFVGDAGLFYEDEALDTYLEGVARTVLASMDVPGDLTFRIRVVRNPMTNASALANGTVHLHTGILARVENEAQLATLLGHELAHYVRRHALSELRTLERSRSQANALGTISLLLAMTGNPAALALAGIGASMTGVLEGQLHGYSRDLEREADRDGFEAMRRAGYDPAQSVRFFQTVLIDEERPEIDDPYFYADHPSMAERVRSYESLLSRIDPRETARVGTEAYMDAVAPLLIENARYDLESGRVRSAKKALDRRIAGGAPSAEAHALLGKWYRASRGGGSVSSAVAEYRRATEIDPELAAAWRGLGLGLRDMARSGEGEVRIEAASAIRKAVSLQPDVADRLILERYAEELEASP